MRNNVNFSKHFTRSPLGDGGKTAAILNALLSSLCSLCCISFVFIVFLLSFLQHYAHKALYKWRKESIVTVSRNYFHTAF